MATKRRYLFGGTGGPIVIDAAMSGSGRVDVDAKLVHILSPTIELYSSATSAVAVGTLSDLGVVGISATGSMAVVLGTQSFLETVAISGTATAAVLLTTQTEIGPLTLSGTATFDSGVFDHVLPSIAISGTATFVATPGVFTEIGPLTLSGTAAVDATTIRVKPLTASVNVSGTGTAAVVLVKALPSIEMSGTGTANALLGTQTILEPLTLSGTATVAALLPITRDLSPITISAQAAVDALVTNSPVITMTAQGSMEILIGTQSLIVIGVSGQGAVAVELIRVKPLGTIGVSATAVVVVFLPHNISPLTLSAVATAGVLVGTQSFIVMDLYGTATARVFLSPSLLVAVSATGSVTVVLKKVEAAFMSGTGSMGVVLGSQTFITVDMYNLTTIEVVLIHEKSLATSLNLSGTGTAAVVLIVLDHPIFVNISGTGFVGVLVGTQSIIAVDVSGTASMRVVLAIFVRVSGTATVAVVLTGAGSGQSPLGEIFRVIDPNDYPPGSVFSVAVVLQQVSGLPSVKLYNRTLSADVAGSEIIAIADFAVHYLESGPLALPAGDHEYQFYKVFSGVNTGKAFLADVKVTIA
mgnify:FL=1